MQLRRADNASRRYAESVRFAVRVTLAVGVVILVHPLPAQQLPQWHPGQPPAETAPREKQEAADKPTLSVQRAAIVERLEERAQRLREFEASLAEGEHPPETLTHEVELLKKLVLVLDRLSTLESENQQYLDERNGNRNELEDLRTLGLADEPPYSYALVDQLQDEILTEQMRIEIVRKEVESASEALGRAMQWHEKTESRRRLAQENSKPPPRNPTRGSWSPSCLSRRWKTSLPANACG